MDPVATAIALCVANLERENDFAHTDGSVARLKATLRALTPEQMADYMAPVCRAKAVEHRKEAKFWLDALRWFAKNPDQPVFRKGQMLIAKGTATSGLRLARRLHGRSCKHLGHWLAQQAQHRAGSLDLPRAANSDTPSSRESAA